MFVATKSDLPAVKQVGMTTVQWVPLNVIMNVFDDILLSRLYRIV